VADLPDRRASLWTLKKGSPRGERDGFDLRGSPRITGVARKDVGLTIGKKCSIFNSLRGSGEGFSFGFLSLSCSDVF